MKQNKVKKFLKLAQSKKVQNAYKKMLKKYDATPEALPKKLREQSNREMQNEDITQEVLKELPMMYYEELGFWSVKRGYGKEIRLDDRFVKKVLKAIDLAISKMDKKYEWIYSREVDKEVELLKEHDRELLSEVFDEIDKALIICHINPPKDGHVYLDKVDFVGMYQQIKQKFGVEKHDG